MCRRLNAFTASLPRVTSVDFTPCRGARCSLIPYRFTEDERSELAPSPSSPDDHVTRRVAVCFEEKRLKFDRPADEKQQQMHLKIRFFVFQGTPRLCVGHADALNGNIPARGAVEKKREKHETIQL
jgi:hypothetical protein